MALHSVTLFTVLNLHAIHMQIMLHQERKYMYMYALLAGCIASKFFIRAPDINRRDFPHVPTGYKVLTFDRVSKLLHAAGAKIVAGDIAIS